MSGTFTNSTAPNEVFGTKPRSFGNVPSAQRGVNDGGSPSDNFLIELEDGSGCIALEDGTGCIELENGP